MKSKNFLLAMWALISLTSIVYAQHKYAVLIGGDPDTTNIPVEDRWNNNQGIGQYGYDEFWNDCYLLWEMLVIEKKYTDENVHVLFNDGSDYTFPGQNIRYTASYHQMLKVTDQPAAKANITQVLSNLSATLDDDDFLFVWIMSHGGNTNVENNGDSYVYLHGYNPANPDAGRLYDFELRDMLNQIPAFKKVVFIQAPHSGAFINKIQNQNTIIFTSCGVSEGSFRSDDNVIINGVTYDVEENEEIDHIKYHHGEFNFHCYSSLAGKTPSGSPQYYNINLTEADIDLNVDSGPF